MRNVGVVGPLGFDIPAPPPDEGRALPSGLAEAADKLAGSAFAREAFGGGGPSGIRTQDRRIKSTLLMISGRTSRHFPTRIGPRPTDWKAASPEQRDGCGNPREHASPDPTEPDAS